MTHPSIHPSTISYIIYAFFFSSGRALPLASFHCQQQQLFLLSSLLFHFPFPFPSPFPSFSGWTTENSFPPTREIVRTSINKWLIRVTVRGTVLAGLRSIAFGPSSGWNQRIRRKSRRKVKKVRESLMEFWNKMVFPVRRVWLSISSRLIKPPKSGMFISS